MAERAGSRARILEMARELFLTKNYQGATLRQIARDAGVTTGSLYHYFSGKDELFVEVCVEGARQLLRRLQTSTTLTEGRPTWERFIALFDAYASFYLEERGYYDLLERLENHPELYNISPELAARVEAVSQETIEVTLSLLRTAELGLSEEETRLRVLFSVALAEGLVKCDRRGLLQRFELSLSGFRGTLISVAKKVIEGQ